MKHSNPVIRCLPGVLSLVVLLAGTGCAGIRSVELPEISYTHWSLGVSPPVASPLGYVEVNGRDLPEARAGHLTYGARMLMGERRGEAEGALLMLFFTPGYHRAGSTYWGLETGPGIGYLDYDPRRPVGYGGYAPRLSVSHLVEVYAGRSAATWQGDFFFEAGVTFFAMDVLRQPVVHVRPLVRVGRVIR